MWTLVSLQFFQPLTWNFVVRKIPEFKTTERHLIFHLLYWKCARSNYFCELKSSKILMCDDAHARSRTLVPLIAMAGLNNLHNNFNLYRGGSVWLPLLTPINRVMSLCHGFWSQRSKCPCLVIHCNEAALGCEIGDGRWLFHQPITDLRLLYLL